MENHPIPQQISSYQFRLVGDMTLKQFLQLAGGALVSLLIYATGLPTLIKWPLIIFFALLGAALAFLPFQERPLEKWILAFFRSVYSPTLYYWKKLPMAPVYFQAEVVGVGTVGLPGTLQGASGSQTDISSTNLEKGELSFLSKLGELFASAPAPAPVPIPQPIVPMAAPPLVSTFTSTPTTQPPPRAGEMQVNIPQISPITVTPTTGPKFVVEEKAAGAGDIAATQVTQTLTTQGVGQTQAAQFSVEAAPPHPPTDPNIIVGQVMDSQGKIVESAILEIQDEQGRPVRALRSNKLGHFMIVTPLLNGHYTIVVEKDGYVFDPLTVEVVGGVIPPIAVRSKQEGAIN